MKRTKRRSSVATARRKGSKTRANKKKAVKPAKLTAEQQEQKKRPFAAIMSKLYKGQKLTRDEQYKLNFAIQMAKRGSKNQYGRT
jgi:hypothetical protein